MAQHPNKPKQVNIENVAHTRSEEFFEFYTNNSEIGLSAWDCRIKFGQLKEVDKRTVIEDQSIAVMSLHHAKALAVALMSSIAQYEQANGSLSIPVVPPIEGEVSNSPQQAKL